MIVLYHLVCIVVDLKDYIRYDIICPYRTVFSTFHKAPDYGIVYNQINGLRPKNIDSTSVYIGLKV